MGFAPPVTPVSAPWSLPLLRPRVRSDFASPPGTKSEVSWQLHPGPCPRPIQGSHTLSQVPPRAAKWVGPASPSGTKSIMDQTDHGSSWLLGLHGCAPGR